MLHTYIWIHVAYVAFAYIIHTHLFPFRWSQVLSPIPIGTVQEKAAEALLRAAEDGRLASALAPKELEQMRQEAADALLRAPKDGTLEKALLKAGGPMEWKVWVWGQCWGKVWLYEILYEYVYINLLPLHGSIEAIQYLSEVQRNHGITVSR